jgi:hypothetical protein
MEFDVKIRALHFKSFSLPHKVHTINDLIEQRKLPVPFRANSRLFPTERDERNILCSKTLAKILRMLCSHIRLS